MSNNTNDDGDDDDTAAVLSPETLALVLNFMHDRDASSSDEQVSPPFEEPVDETFTYQTYIDRFRPQYGMSQFWYAETTASELVAALDRICKPDTTIAFLCCPSGYAAFNARSSRPIPADQVFLLEYDTRFARLAGRNFVYYDLDDPPEPPISQGGASLAGSIDIVVVDPPYHSVASQKKIAQFIPYIAKSSFQVLILTGMALGDDINEIYKPALGLGRARGSSARPATSLQLMDLEVKHDGSGSQLQNQYGCWTNAIELLQAGPP